jgi:hypothetical protein
MKKRKADLTGANRGNGARISVLSVSSCSNPGVNMNPEGFRDDSNRNGDVDFKFLACRAGVRRRRARDAQPPYVDNPESFRDKPELRSYKAVFVVGDEDLSRRSQTKAEVSQFSDEITVNCAPLVKASVLP